jgi:opacity protein-like surface antigen
MVKRTLSIALAAVACFGTARAADMPMPKLRAAQAPMAAPVPTGWYLDVLGQGAVLKPGGGINTLAPAGAGIAFGGGYDFTGGNNVLIGLYANAAWVNVRSTATCAFLNCTSGNTWEGEAGGRVGLTFASLNGFLGSNPTFQNLNSRLSAPLVSIAPLNSAMIYIKLGAAIQHIKASVDGIGSTQNDIGVRVGAGVEMPVLNSFAWRTEIDYTKFNQALCGGCALPTGRPAEWAGKTGVVYKF